MRKWFRDYKPPIIAGIIAALVVGGLATAGTGNFSGGGSFVSSSGGGGAAGVSTISTADTTHITVSNGSGPTATLDIGTGVQLAGTLSSGCAAHTALRTTTQGGTPTCDNVVNSCGTSLSCSSGTANVSLPTENGAFTAGDFGTQKVIQAIGADGTGTLTGAGLPSLDQMQGFVEDFPTCGNNDGNGTFGTTNSGAVTNPTITKNNSGLCGFSTGTANLAGTERWNTYVNNYDLEPGTGKWFFRARVSQEVLSTSTQGFSLRVGWGNSATASPTAGLYFLYDHENVETAPTTGAGNTGNKNNWICRSVDASSSTEYVMDGTVTSDQGYTTHNETIAANTFYDIEIDYDSTLGTPEADFYVNGDLGCKITTHLPSTTGTTHTVGVIIDELKNVGTGTAGIADFDYIEMFNTGLSR